FLHSFYKIYDLTVKRKFKHQILLKIKVDENYLWLRCPSSDIALAAFREDYDFGDLEEFLKKLNNKNEQKTEVMLNGVSSDHVEPLLKALTTRSNFMKYSLFSILLETDSMFMLFLLCVCITIRAFATLSVTFSYCILLLHRMASMNEEEVLLTTRPLQTSLTRLQRSPSPPTLSRINSLNMNFYVIFMVCMPLLLAKRGKGPRYFSDLLIHMNT
uniref:Uncharacterized protein n=1 Tax=Glossina palpalis gambiensis TaxID=67801 RepID=A0A1B0BCC9_9MUSC